MLLLKLCAYVYAVFAEACESYGSNDSWRPTNVWGQSMLHYIT